MYIWWCKQVCMRAKMKLPTFSLLTKSQRKVSTFCIYVFRDSYKENYNVLHRILRKRAVWIIHFWASGREEASNWPDKEEQA